MEGKDEILIRMLGDPDCTDIISVRIYNIRIEHWRGHAIGQAQTEKNFGLNALQKSVTRSTSCMSMPLLRQPFAPDTRFSTLDNLGR
jgi:hypothetical protein